METGGQKHTLCRTVRHTEGGSVFHIEDEAFLTRVHRPELQL